MNVYQKEDGTWVGTQAEAGHKNVTDLPTTSKQEMLEWLNANRVNYLTANDSNDSVPAVVDTPDSALGKCPKCSLTKGGAAKIAAGMTVDAIGNLIATKQGWELMRLMEAVIDRCVELKNEQVPVST